MGMKKREPRRWRWVTRDPDDCDVEVWPGLKKPTLESHSYSFNDYWLGSGDAAAVCLEEWRRLFGELPPTDRPIKIVFSAERL